MVGPAVRVAATSPEWWRAARRRPAAARCCCTSVPTAPTSPARPRPAWLRSCRWEDGWSSSTAGRYCTRRPPAALSRRRPSPAFPPRAHIGELTSSPLKGAASFARGRRPRGDDGLDRRGALRAGALPPLPDVVAAFVPLAFWNPSTHDRALPCQTPPTRVSFLRPALAQKNLSRFFVEHCCCRRYCSQQFFTSPLPLEASPPKVRISSCRKGKAV